MEKVGAAFQYELHRWDVGVATMRKAELARFLIKPDWAYGRLGCPPRIPPDAVGKHLTLGNNQCAW